MYLLISESRFCRTIYDVSILCSSTTRTPFKQCNSRMQRIRHFLKEFSGAVASQVRQARIALFKGTEPTLRAPILYCETMPQALRQFGRFTLAHPVCHAFNGIFTDNINLSLDTLNSTSPGESALGAPVRTLCSKYRNWLASLQSGDSVSICPAIREAQDGCNAIIAKVDGFRVFWQSLLHLCDDLELYITQYERNILVSKFNSC